MQGWRYGKGLIYYRPISALCRSTNINHKGLQRTANEYAGKRRIYKDLISKNEK